MTARLHRHPITFALAVLLTPAALAAPSPATTAEPMGPLYACANLMDDAARLACFDKQVAALRGAEQAGAFKAVDRSTVEQIQKESFGFNLPNLPRLGFPKIGGGKDDAGPSAQTYTIARISGSERPIFFMTDGTIWRQVEVETNRNVRVGASVVVEKAALGSFLLSPTKGGGRGLRVKREE
jgi:hypothetical protein